MWLWSGQPSSPLCLWLFALPTSREYNLRLRSRVDVQKQCSHRKHFKICKSLCHTVAGIHTCRGEGTCEHSPTSTRFVGLFISLTGNYPTMSSMWPIRAQWEGPAEAALSMFSKQLQSNYDLKANTVEKRCGLWSCVCAHVWFRCRR